MKQKPICPCGECGRKADGCVNPDICDGYAAYKIMMVIWSAEMNKRRRVMAQYGEDMKALRLRHLIQRQRKDKHNSGRRRRG